ncbi:MAG: cupin fold metalloprotein, WbuC family [Candidatus Anammoximicrobium sp.]|nr:cupin fold metalloprotein, WbuC family [Candidatus Anammoximicrobium sp.]
MAQWQEVGPDVFYTTRWPVAVSDEELRWLEDKARVSSRGRARLCAHPDPEAWLHEMVICLARTSYVRPHRHQRPESAHIIRGAGDLVLFDEQGGVRKVLPLSDCGGGKAFFVRLAEPVYHTYVLKTDFLTFHETTLGPLDRALTEFAPWAPADAPSAAAFMERLRADLAAANRA